MLLATQPSYGGDSEVMLLLTAVIPRTNLARLVESIAPLRVTIDEERGRVIRSPRSSSFLPRGLSVGKRSRLLGFRPHSNPGDNQRLAAPGRAASDVTR